MNQLSPTPPTDCIVCRVMGAPKEDCPHESVSRFSIKRNRALLEKALIERALRLTHGHMTRAAAYLGISLRTLYTKLRVYNLESLTRPRSRTDQIAQKEPGTFSKETPEA